MGEEMHGVEGDTGWRKAIPEARDRLQSRVMVCVVGTLLILETIIILHQIYFLWGTARSSELLAIARDAGISVAFACLVLGVRAATLAGSALGRDDLPDPAEWNFFLRQHDCAIGIDAAGFAVRAHVSRYASWTTQEGKGRAR